MTASQDAHKDSVQNRRVSFKENSYALRSLWYLDDLGNEISNFGGIIKCEINF